MIFQRINRTDAEKIFAIVRNDYTTAALANGQTVQWNFGATTPDGLGVTRPTARATSGGFAVAGVIAQAIPAGGYGLCQIYGFHSAVRARSVTGGTPAIAKGRPLIANVAGSVFVAESVATASNITVKYPFAFAMGATSGFTTSAIAAFIKAM